MRQKVTDARAAAAPTGVRSAVLGRHPADRRPSSGLIGSSANPRGHGIGQQDVPCAEEPTRPELERSF
jgi:hypothetical protein